MSSLDKTDEKIISILKADARKAFVEIAQEIGLSESAVRRRVKNLVDLGAIKKFTIEMGLTKKTSAITLISVSPSIDTSKVSERLKSLKGVDTVYEITGQYDIVAIVSAPTIAEINKSIDEVRRISGVDDTNTVIILRTVS